MKIAEVMTRDVRVIQPDRTVRDAARLMDEMNVGVLPVCDGKRLVGMITDRDIAVRSTATGLAPDRHLVEEIMSRSLQWCFADDDVREVLTHMSDKQIRRMPVVDQDKNLVGIVALGDFATDRAPGVDEAMRRISTPSEPDRSGTPTIARADQSRGRTAPRLTEDEQRELEARRHAPGRDRGFGGGASDVGPPESDLQDFPEDYRSYGARDLSDEDVRRAGAGFSEGWREEADRSFRFRDEDDRRAAFAGGFNRPYGEGERPGRMRGGFGGEGYGNYGEGYGRGARGAGARGPAFFGDYGSHRDGTPLNYGSEGEEGYDRGMSTARERGFSGHGTRFSNETRGYGIESGQHRGRGPKGYARSDDRVREDVCERLTDDPQVDASELEVKVEHGEVTLFGTVPNRADKRRAEDLAESVPGVRHVQNNLRVRQGAMSAAGNITGGNT